MTPEDAKQWIDGVFDSYVNAADADVDARLPDSITAAGRRGKLYEAYVLAVVLQKLKDQEGFEIEFVAIDGKLKLRWKGGPITNGFSHFVLRRPDLVLKAWTDIEFLTLSYDRRNGGRRIGNPGYGDYHELDIVVTREDATGRPRYSDIKIAIECKAVERFDKDIVRAALGVRRELSLLRSEVSTSFTNWPQAAVPAYPPSILQVYSSNPDVKRYDEAGQFFGVGFVHLPFGYHP